MSVGVGLIAKKLGMTSIFDVEKNEIHATTVLLIQDNQVVGKRTQEVNGYVAVQVGAFNKRHGKSSHSYFYKKHGITEKCIVREFRLEELQDLDIGAELDVSIFSEGGLIDITGTSKGKGFAGGMKRHNFGGLEASHGVSVSHRSHGSTGNCQDPGKVWKGKKMAGHLGSAKVTMQNLRILRVVVDRGLLFVKGVVAGYNGSYVVLRSAIKKRSLIVRSGSKN